MRRKINLKVPAPSHVDRKPRFGCRLRNLPPLEWTAVPSPTNPAQRIEYLRTCQTAFSKLNRTTPCCRSIRPLPTLDDASDPNEPMHVTWPRARHHPHALLDVALIACASCPSVQPIHQTTPYLANPFSSWLVPLCAPCAAAMEQ